MQLEAKVMTHSPSSRPTKPRLRVVPVRHDVPTPPRFVEIIRVDPGYSLVTLLIDVIWASMAVLMAQLSFPGTLDQERNVALYSWLFVPTVIAVMAVIA